MLFFFGEDVGQLPRLFLLVQEYFVLVLCIPVATLGGDATLARIIGSVAFAYVLLRTSTKNSRWGRKKGEGEHSMWTGRFWESSSLAHEVILLYVCTIALN